MARSLDKKSDLHVCKHWISLLGITVIAPVQAVQFDYSYGVEMEYTDNATLASTNERQDVVSSALFGMSLEEQTSTIEADISTMLEYSNYRDDSFPDEDWFYLNGDLTWTVRPRTFFWVVEDYYSQQQLDVLSPETPNNLINTNVFSTGPDLVFRINPANHVNVGARLSDFRYDRLNTDSERFSLDTAWLYRFSAVSEVSINVGHQTARFDEIDGADFDRQNVFLRYSDQRGRSAFQVDAGTSYIQREEADNVNGFLGKLLWRNQFRDQSYFQLDLSAQYTDSGQDLLTYRPLVLSSSQINGDLFYDRRAEATYNLSIYNSTYQLLVIYRDEDYETLPQDRTIKGVRLVYGYVASATLSYNSQIEYREYDNTDADRTDERLTGVLSATYRLSRDYTLQLQYNYLEQQSDIETSSYTENRVLLNFYYGRNPRSYR